MALGQPGSGRESAEIWKLTHHVPLATGQEAKQADRSSGLLTPWAWARVVVVSETRRPAGTLGVHPAKLMPPAPCPLFPQLWGGDPPAPLPYPIAAGVCLGAFTALRTGRASVMRFPPGNLTGCYLCETWLQQLPPELKGFLSKLPQAISCPLFSAESPLPVQPSILRHFCLLT